jgi:hypothetical protein
MKRTFRLEDGEMEELGHPQRAEPHKKRVVDRLKCRECRRDKQKVSAFPPCITFADCRTVQPSRKAVAHAKVQPVQRKGLYVFSQ